MAEKPEVQEPVIPAKESASTISPTPVPESVTMSKEAFDALMERLNSIESTQALQMSVLNKNDANKIDEMRRAGKLVKSVKVRQIGGKFIIGWKTLENDVFMQEGRLIEKQTLEYYLKDQTDKDKKNVINLREFAVTPQLVSCEVTAENKDAEGNLTFSVRAPDGEQFNIGLSFVN